MSQFNRIDQSKLYPPFLEAMKLLYIACEKRGYVFFCIEAYRSPERQSQLYSQGRSTPGKIITNAKAFESYHQFGIATDSCRDKDGRKENGLQPDWDMEAYKVLQEECHKLNLTSGLDFKSFPEGPHIQWKTKTPLSVLRAEFEKGGLNAVFEKLDKE